MIQVLTDCVDPDAPLSTRRMCILLTISPPPTSLPPNRPLIPPPQMPLTYTTIPSPHQMTEATKILCLLLQIVGVKDVYVTTKSWRQMTKERDSTSMAIRRHLQYVPPRKSLGWSVGSNAIGFRRPSLQMRKPRREMNHTSAPTPPLDLLDRSQSTREALEKLQAIIVGWREVYNRNSPSISDGCHLRAAELGRRDCRWEGEVKQGRGRPRKHYLVR